MEPLLKVRQVTKRFPGVLALDHVDFDLAPGEIHALLGENGAGKSTLIKIITGAYRMDEGSLTLEGRECRFASPAEAQAAGIGVIFQEFSLIDSLSVAENIFLGAWPMRGGRVDWAAMNAAARALCDQFGVAIRPTDIVSTLGVATRQMVEILKVLRRADLRVLIMDEPTSALSEAEAQALFAFLANLNAQGLSVIYISHRLDEIRRLCHRITVLRNGKRITTESAKGLSVPDIVAKMLGSELADPYPQKSRARGAEVLRVQGLSAAGVDHVDLSVHAGEVLGLTGLVGAGKTEILEAIFGARPVRAGQIFLDDAPIATGSPRAAIAQGIGLLPESRKTQGLVLQLSCMANISLASLDRIARPVIDRQRERRAAQDYFTRLEVRPGDPANRVGNLSGGNQQKVVLAKWLMRECRVLLFDEPTRGIDVGAKFQIYSTIIALAEAGLAVIVASSEIEEIAGICNRALVLRKGRIIADLTDTEVVRERILQATVGEIHAV